MIYLRTNTILPVKSVSIRRFILALGLSLGLAACDSDLRTDSVEGDPGSAMPPATPTPGSSAGQASNSDMTLQVGSGTVALVEGAQAISIPVSVTRTSATPRPVTLVAQGQTNADEQQLSWAFDDATLAANESSTNLILQLAIAPGPIVPQTRELRVTARDDTSSELTVALSLQVQPTDLADVYLLVGQSNTMGFSEDGSKQADTGEPDAPNARILQLNVTGNDDENFSTAADFTTPENLFNTGAPLSLAVDPLHDGFDSRIDGKGGTRIGFGLSFAKAALADTTADIYLVPAAWSDTGFCKRDTNRLPGIGWNATEKSNSALSGTLLHDRAIERTNIALAETGGILRGILWHQGEADSDDAACAQSYATNLTELVNSLRTQIDPDARGAIARGANSDVPFIAGTMSKGADARSDQLPFSDTKELVDAAHRNIGNLVNRADFVNNDDLVPPAYPCGEGSCVHFGAAAYREMGARYYDRLKALLQ